MEGGKKISIKKGENPKVYTKNSMFVIILMDIDVYV